jgi:hypothetical protein
VALAAAAFLGVPGHGKAADRTNDVIMAMIFAAGLGGAAKIGINVNYGREGLERPATGPLGNALRAAALVGVVATFGQIGADHVVDRVAMAEAAEATVLMGGAAIRLVDARLSGRELGQGSGENGRDGPGD